MRLNAAFLVGCIFLLSACAPLQPEPGVNFKDFNSKSALNMRGYIIPAGMYKDVGVSRYETRWQKLQRERGEAQPANGWVFYYEKDGVMISETELLALQSQRQKELQVAQSKARQTVNNRNVSQNNLINSEQSSNSSTVAQARVSAPRTSNPSTNRSTLATTSNAVQVVNLTCQPFFYRIIDRSGVELLRGDNQTGDPVRITLQSGKLIASAPKTPDIKVSYDGAVFKSKREAEAGGLKGTLLGYEKKREFNGGKYIDSIFFHFAPSRKIVYMTTTTTSDTAPNIFLQSLNCE